MLRATRKPGYGRPRPTARLAGLLALLLLLVLLPAASWCGTASNQVLILGDIHFDPFADPSLVDDLATAPVADWQGIFASSADQTVSQPGHETNYALLESSLTAMRSAVEQPDFAIFEGDVLRHHFNEYYEHYTGDSSQSGLRAFVLKTFEFVVGQISAAFPTAPVYFTLGNNDSYSGDYSLAPQGQFLSDVGEVLADYFLRDPADRQTFQDTFSQGGYYSLLLPGDNNTRVIGVNTIFFSVDYQDPGETQVDYDPARRQLGWLAAELDAATARGERVWLISHIPPGMNVYDTVHDPANTASHMTEGDVFWRQEYADEYLALVRDHANTVAATLSGHTHMDDFRLIFAQDNVLMPVSWVHINPSISPIFGNNPGFKVFSINTEDLAVTGADVYHLDVTQPDPAWAFSYSFDQAYGQLGLNQHSLRAVRNQMLTDQRTRTTYTGNYDSQSPTEAITPDQLLAYWVGMGVFSGPEFVRVYNLDAGRGVLAR